MRILLVDSVHVAMDFFPFVAEKLKGAVANVQVDAQTLADDYGIPGFLAHSARGYDHVFVFLTHDNSTFSLQRLNTVVSKVIDVEIARDMQVFLVVRNTVNEDLSEAGQKTLGAEAAEYCHDVLLNPEAIQSLKGKLDQVSDEKSAESAVTQAFSMFE
ncbi:MAG: hypothetical protein GOV15_02605 [Candidatus Diapherotrites archaeon]|nr:hypothetical protein [Candidatus Diapherotrites archaeon]